MNRRAFGQTLGAAAITVAAPLISETPAEAAPSMAGALPAPVFLHEIDQRLFNELAQIERTLATVKAKLLRANIAHPLVRSALLFDMRCSFQELAPCTGWAWDIVYKQRTVEQAATDEWKRQARIDVKDRLTGA